MLILKSTSCQWEIETKLRMLASRPNNKDQNTLKAGVQEGQSEWHSQETEPQQVYLSPKFVQSS